MSIAVITEQVVGIFYIVIGLAMLINPFSWHTLIKDMRSFQTFTFVLALITLLFAATIVTTHNIWSASPEVITTIVGWVGLLKAFSLLAMPRPLLVISEKIFERPTLVRAISIFALVLGLLIFYYSSVV